MPNLMELYASLLASHASHLSGDEEVVTAGRVDWEAVNGRKLKSALYRWGSFYVDWYPSRQFRSPCRSQVCTLHEKDSAYSTARQFP